MILASRPSSVCGACGLDLSRAHAHALTCPTQKPWWNEKVKATLDTVNGTQMLISGIDACALIARDTAMDFVLAHTRSWAQALHDKAKAEAKTLFPFQEDG